MIEEDPSAPGVVHPLAPTTPLAPVIVPAVESLLLAAARVVTFEGQRLLTNASGFFFERDGRLFLVTSRHVMLGSSLLVVGFPLGFHDAVNASPFGRHPADADRALSP